MAGFRHKQGCRDAVLAQMGQRTVAQLVKGPLPSRCFTEQRPRPLVGQPPLASLALYFVYYNFCRIHKTLRVTPAMEAGLADMPRDAEWIVELVDATGPKPGSKQGTQ